MLLKKNNQSVAKDLVFLKIASFLGLAEKFFNKVWKVSVWQPIFNYPL